MLFGIASLLAGLALLFSPKMRQQVLAWLTTGPTTAVSRSPDEDQQP
jgi:hypothetical protein